jgi:hypothetical protein
VVARYAGKVGAPELLCLPTILPLEPVDVVTILVWRGQMDGAAGSRRFVEAPHFLQDDTTRPTIEDEVMMTQENIPTVAADPENRKLKQWRLSQIEASFHLLAHDVAQFLFLLLRRKLAPVLAGERNSDVLVHLLHRLLEILPVKGRAQDIVPVQHSLPCQAESVRIQILHHVGSLVDVHAHARVP